MSESLEFSSLRFFAKLTIFAYIIALSYHSLFAHQGPGTTYSSYQSEIFCEASFPTEYPETIVQVQEIVRRAIELNSTVKAFGSRHTVQDSICTDGIPIDMSRLNYIHLNPQTHFVQIGAGAQLGDLCSKLERNGRALRGHVPSFGGVTIGGALGTGARGSTLRHKVSLSDQIVSLTIVDGTGTIRTINETDPDFSAFRVHLGLLAIIIDVTFQTVPAFKMRIHNYGVSDTGLRDGSLLNLASVSDWFQLWWFPSTHSVVVSKGDFVSNSTAGNARTFAIPGLNPAIATLTRSVFEMGESLRSPLILSSIQRYTEASLYTQVPFRTPVLSEDGGSSLTNPAVGYVHALMQNTCSKQLCAWNQGIYVQEFAFALDLSRFDDMVRGIQNILHETPAYFPVYGIFLRFAPRSNALMAVEYGRPTVHVEIVTPMRKDPFNTPRAGLGAYQAIAQLLEHLGGRFHWSMCGPAFHTADKMSRNVPNVLAFRRLVQKYDERGIFMNNFGRRVMGISNDLTVDPRVKHCALQDYCICANNSDCAVGQICFDLKGFNACKTL